MIKKKYLSYTTVQLRTNIGEGTGFLVDLKRNNNETIPILITNKHVLDGINEVELTLTVQKEDGKFYTQNNKLTDIQKSIVFDKKSDLCALAFSPLFMKTFKLHRKIVFQPINITDILTEEDYLNYDCVEDILIVGYPNSFIDKNNNLPITISGITATPLFANYENRNEFLVNSNVYYGSSGSPVFVIRKGTIKLAGIISSFKNILIDSTFNNLSMKTEGFCEIPSGIGIAIKSSELKRIFNEIYSKLDDMFII